MVVPTGPLLGGVDRLEPVIGESDCERLRDGLLAQPVNTWSSLAFVAVAIAVARAARPGHERADRGFALLLAATGAGSVAFHGPQPAIAGWLHDFPIVGLVGFVAVAETRSRRAGIRRTGIGRRPVGAPGRSAPARPWTGAALASLLVGAACWATGRTDGPLCAPDGLVQLHACWHLLAAVSLGCWWRSWSLRSSAPVSTERSGARVSG